MKTGSTAAPVGAALPPHHKGRIEDLFRSLDRRHMATGCPRNCDALVDQLALRAAVTGRGAHRKDRKVLQAVTARILRFGHAALDVERVAGPGEGLPVVLELPRWFLAQPLATIAGLDHALAATSHRALRVRGQTMVDTLRAHAGNQSLIADPNDFVMMLAGLDGRTPATSRVTIKQAWEPISRACLETVLAHLSPGSEDQAWLNLVRHQGASPGLTRLFARTIWLTGMRPREVFSCRLGWSDPVSGTPPDPSDFPAFDPVDPMRCLAEVRRDIAVHAAERVAVLAIRTAKTRCGAPTLDNRLRCLHLAGIDPDDLLRLWMSAQFRTLNLTRTRMDSCRRYCTVRLGQASRIALPDRVHRINLKLLRHAFIDTCRRTLPLHAVAALSGHTSIKTARHYGGKSARPSRHRDRTRWMPQPDPVAGPAWFRQAWDRRSEPQRAPKPPVPAPGPGMVPA